MGSGNLVAREDDDGGRSSLEIFLDDENHALSTYLLIVCGAVAAAVITWRVVDVATKYARTIACLGTDRQRYFAIPSPNVALLKNHLLYAPVLSKRHNREIQLSSAVNVGTLPTRFQLLFLAAYLGTNIAFCVVAIPFAGEFEDGAKALRNRAGVLATVNLIPLFVLAGRNNPLIPLLGISFDTYNLMHRWFGRIVVLEAVTHVLAHYASHNWEGFAETFSSEFLLWGFVSAAAMVVISFQAWSPLRHAYYEIFKILHIFLAIAALIGLGYHLDIAQLPQMKYFVAAVIIWASDRLWRGVRVFYHNVGASRTKAMVEALPGNACRITVTLARPWRASPGQHAYLYMPSIGLWQSHPFTVAWSEGSNDVVAEKLANDSHLVPVPKKMQVSFVVRARTGFTDSLYQKVAKSSGGRIETTCLVEGPYGVKHPLHSYGSVALFAGGVGISHQVPYVRDLVAGYSQGTVATRKILLVWTIQSPEHLEWIRPWMTEILAMDKRREVLRIMLFVSQPRSTKEIHSPSSTVQMFPGRPNCETLLAMEQDQQIGAMAVSVCGPGSFSDEVRRAVRRRQSQTTIDFIEEAFSW